jgi:DNA-directed RNA polymerase sigma subunit (sigma70/sigma32)
MTYADVHAARAKRVAAADLSGLRYRERRVLELYYGLGGDSDPDELAQAATKLGINGAAIAAATTQEPRSLDFIGRTFNVTRERIRQIVKQGERNLGLADLPEFRPWWQQSRAQRIAGSATGVQESQAIRG